MLISTPARVQDPVARDVSAHFMQQRRECERLRKEAAAAALAAVNATGAATAAEAAAATEAAAAAVVCTAQPFDEMVEERTAVKPEGVPDACWRFSEEVRSLACVARHSCALPSPWPSPSRWQRRVCVR